MNFRRVYVDGELTGEYHPDRDMAAVRKGIIRALQQQGEASGARESYEKILDGLYGPAINKVVDDLHDILGL